MPLGKCTILNARTEQKFVGYYYSGKEREKEKSTSPNNYPKNASFMTWEHLKHIAKMDFSQQLSRVNCKLNSFDAYNFFLQQIKKNILLDKNKVETEKRKHNPFIH